MSALDHAKLKQELDALNDPRRAAVFAVRMAMCALPFLADSRAEEKGFCWFWKKAERTQHLLAILRALQVAWFVVETGDRRAVADVIDKVIITGIRATTIDEAFVAETLIKNLPVAHRDPDKMELLHKLNTLLPSQFEEVLFAYNAPHEYFSNTTQSQRAIDLIRYAESRNELTILQQIIQAMKILTDQVAEKDVIGVDAAADARTIAGAVSAALSAAVSTDTDTANTKAISAAIALKTVTNQNTIEELIEHEARRLKEDDKLAVLLQHAFFLPPMLTTQKETFLSQLKKIPEFDYWTDWLAARYQGDPTDSAILKKSVLLPREIQAKSPRAINAYLKMLSGDREKCQLDRVRAIFIGHGAAGKTSLVRALHGEAVVEGKEDMTPGVDIRSWPVTEDIRADLWDFGGQVVAHATHQLFLRSRCLYVLVLAGREEIGADQQAEYWLEHVRTFGGKAPVLLVGNKADVEAVQLNLTSLQQRHNNIKGFYSLSCTHYQEESFSAKFQSFATDFRNELIELNRAVNVDFLPSHFNVMEILEAESRDKYMLPKSRFDELCREHQIQTQGTLNRKELLDLLDKLGVVVYFPRLRQHRNTYVLDPRWLTYGMYTLIYAQQTRRQEGRLTLDDVNAILGSHKVEFAPGKAIRFPEKYSYPPKKCEFIIAVMEHFKVCYRLPNDRLIIPARLPTESPATLDFDTRGALAFELEFKGFLPRHIMPGLIVARHGEIEDERVWQTGVQLHCADLNTRALVTASYYSRMLYLWVHGEHAARYFERLLDDVLELKKNMNGMQMTEWVLLDDSALTSGPGGGSKVELRLLWEYEKLGIPVFPDKNGNKYMLREVMKKMPKENASKQSDTNIHIHGNVGNFAYAGWNMQHTRVGDVQVNVQQQLAEAYRKTGDLEDMLEIKVADPELRDPALNELKLVRKALKTLQQEAGEDKPEALEKLSRFGDRLKKGGSDLVAALKTLKSGGEAVAWLNATIPGLVAGAAKMLGL